MTTTASLLALYRSTSTRYHAAVTSAVESGDTCTLVVLGDGADWEDGVPAAYYARQFFSVSKGTGIGEWQPVAVTDAIAAAITSAVSGGLAGYASESYVDAAIAALPSDDDSGLCAVPGAGSTVSLALNTARTPNASRPTLVTVSGSWSWSLSATGTVAGTLSVKSDSSSTPTTAVATLPFSRSVTVGITVGDAGSIPYSVSYHVPAGHSYVLATSGAGTFGTPLVVEQTL